MVMWWDTGSFCLLMILVSFLIFSSCHVKLSRLYEKFWLVPLWWFRIIWHCIVFIFNTTWKVSFLFLISHRVRTNFCGWPICFLCLILFCVSIIVIPFFTLLCILHFNCRYVTTRVITYRTDLAPSLPDLLHLTATKYIFHPIVLLLNSGLLMNGLVWLWN